MLSPIDYHGWPAMCLASRELELIAPLAVGPRVISLRRLGSGRNVFFEFKDQLGGSGETGYRVRGGHRLWYAPEDEARTCQLDNTAPTYTALSKGRGFVLTASVEEKTGIEKAMRVELVSANTVRVTHTLTNRGLWPVQTAAWALTMLRRGGMSVIPLLPKGEHPRDLLPTYSIVPWSYTDLGLPAWKFLPGFIRVETAKIPGAQKLGLTDYPGWSAYWIAGDLFVKQAAVKRGATYPDLGCPFETYADTCLTELETLSPLEFLEPGQKIVHTETWGLLADVPKPTSEAVYRAEILPAVNRWLEAVD